MSEWNDGTTGERMRRLRHRLQSDPLVDSVELKPGGALDAMRVELKQYIGSVPESVALAVYEEGLEIRNVGGYKSVTVSPVERVGGSLADDQEAER